MNEKAFLFNQGNESSRFQSTVNRSLSIRGGMTIRRRNVKRDGKKIVEFEMVRQSFEKVEETSDFNDTASLLEDQMSASQVV